MTLSIVIVNYNVKLYLEQCLLSVYKAVEDVDSEIFVVDNASSDDSIAYLKPLFPDVIFIENKENSGFSKANNQAIEQAVGKYILLLNPDTVLGENVLKNVISFMESYSDAGGVGVKMINREGDFLPESKRSLPTPWNSFCKMFGLAKLFPYSPTFGKYRLLYLDKNQMHQVDVLSGAFMFLRSEALSRSGLLDESFFMYGEDIDLSYRLLLAGYKNYYLPQTIIHYKGESTKKESLKYVTTFYGAILLFYKKHFSNQNKLFSLLIHLSVYLLLIYTFVRNQIMKPSKHKIKEEQMRIPRQNQSYEQMILEIERLSSKR